MEEENNKDDNDENGRVSKRMIKTSTQAFLLSSLEEEEEKSSYILKCPLSFLRLSNIRKDISFVWEFLSMRIESIIMKKSGWRWKRMRKKNWKEKRMNIRIIIRISSSFFSFSHSFSNLVHYPLPPHPTHSLHLLPPFSGFIWSWRDTLHLSFGWSFELWTWNKLEREEEEICSMIELFSLIIIIIFSIIIICKLKRKMLSKMMMMIRPMPDDEDEKKSKCQQQDIVVNAYWPF